MEIAIEITVADPRQARVAVASLLPELAAKVPQEGLVPLTLVAGDATLRLTIKPGHSAAANT